MLSPITIVQTEAQAAAVIHLTIPREKIQELMCPAITEVMETLATQGITPAGPLFSHHFEMTPEVFNFEVGLPVSAPVKPAGRVKAGVLPEAKVIRTVYTGSCEKLGEAWGLFLEQAEAAGHRMAPNLWERYLSNSGEDPVPATWQIELNRPLL